MALVESLLTAIVRADGDALVMHVGEKPYVVASAGPIHLSTQGLNLQAMAGMVTQLLPADLQRALTEFGAVEHELPSRPATNGDRFTVVVARGGDDIWIEIRRHRRSVQPATPEAVPSPAPVATAPVEHIAVADTPVDVPIEQIPVVEVAHHETATLESPVHETPVVETPVLETPIVDVPVTAPPVLEPQAAVADTPEPVALAVEPAEVWPVKIAPQLETMAAPEIELGVPEPGDAPKLTDVPESLELHELMAVPHAIEEPELIDVPQVIAVPEVREVPAAFEMAALGSEVTTPAFAVAAAPVAAAIAFGAPSAVSTPAPAAACESNSGENVHPATTAAVVPTTRTLRIEVPPAGPRQPNGPSEIERLMSIAAARGATALYLTTDASPFVRVDDDVRALDGEPPLSATDIESAVVELMPEATREALRRGDPTEWVSELANIGRVRCSTFRDYRGPGASFQLISVRPLTAE